MKTKKNKRESTDDLANIEIQDAPEVLFKGILTTFKNVVPDVIWRHSSEEHQSDKDIDYQIEVENKKTRETLIIFKTQNKGTAEKLVPIKITRNNGMIPFSIKIKHGFISNRLSTKSYLSSKPILLTYKPDFKFIMFKYNSICGSIVF